MARIPENKGLLIFYHTCRILASKKCRCLQESGKLLALRHMLAAGFKPPMLVFVASKERAKALHAELMYESVHVDSIHADQSQAARSAAITSFRKGTTWVLIATDLLARGMDFLGVQIVINYDFPNTKTDYIHRWPPSMRCVHFNVVASCVAQGRCCAVVHVQAQP